MAVARYRKTSKAMKIRQVPDFVPLTARQAEKLWPRHPAAFDLGERYWVILPVLEGSQKRHYSLNSAAKLLGSSHRTLTSWEKAGVLVRDKVTGKYHAGHLKDFARTMWDLNGGKAIWHLRLNFSLGAISLQNCQNHLLFSAGGLRGPCIGHAASGLRPTKPRILFIIRHLIFC